MHVTQMIEDDVSEVEMARVAAVCATLQTCEEEPPRFAFAIAATGGEATRLTESSGIDTQPAFSPDGQWIAFTSDRGGSPQIYRMPAAGGPPQRLTFDGTYNVGPRY